MNQNILTSGGNEFAQEYKEADLAALANAKNPKELLVVVTAPYPTQKLAFKHAQKYFATIGVEAQMSPILEAKDAANETFAQELAASGAIYFAGGTPSRLVDAFINTLAGEALQAALANNAVIMGSSAGAMLMSKRVIMPSGEDLGPGLDLLHGAMVLPHFHGVIPDWVKNMQKQGIKFYGLKEGGSVLTSSTDATLITEFGSVTQL